MSQTLSIMSSKIRKFDREIIKEIARRNNLSNDFVVHCADLTHRYNKRLIRKSFIESIPLAIILIIPIWVFAYILVPEIFQSQSNILTKGFGYLMLISLSLWSAWSIVDARMPKIEKGSFEEELKSAEKILKPMIEKFLDNPSGTTDSPPVEE